MTVDEIRTLFEYNAWANQRTLEACAPLTDEQFTRPLGNSFSSLRDTLFHILGAEWIWLERWYGRTPTILPSPEPYPTLASLRKRWDEVGHDLQQFVRSLTADDLARHREIRTIDGTPYTHPLWQMMQHLANHSTYHRGQVTTLLRQLGFKPVSTDLIRFYRERAAKAQA